MEVLKQRISRYLKVTPLALLLVSVFLYSCSPTPVPQASSQVQPAEPQVEALMATAAETDQEVRPEAEAALPPDVDLTQSEPVPASPAQAEPAGGIGGGQESQPAAPPEAQPQAKSAAESAPAPEAAAPSAGSGTEPTVGSIAPEFSLQTLDGQTVNMAALRGKNILLNYWVTWCIPCMEELPIIDKIYQEFQSQNLVVLSVNGINQDEIAKVKEVANEKTPSLPVILDENDALYNSYWVRFMPTSFFIDENGVIRHIQLGNAPEEKLRDKIQMLISDQF